MTKSLQWQIWVEVKYSGGTGEPNDPYRIATPEDLIEISIREEDWGKCFIVVNDIDMEGYTITQPIGGDSLPFTGVFDGKGHTILNFRYSDPNNGYVGLFGAVGSCGEIRNLGLIDVNVFGHSDLVGGLVGYNGGGTITNCFVTGTVSGDCDNVGGIVGKNKSGGTITGSYAIGAVFGRSHVGGLLGVNNWGTISNCYATCSVSGNDNVGGLVGENYDTISDCYSIGTVFGSDMNTVGGLAGINTDGTITNSFWDIETSDCNTNAGGIGKTTAEMKTKSTFTDAGWDFVNIWDMCEGTNYPRLRRQIPSADWICPDGVGFEDFSYLADGWQMEFGISNLATLCEQWLMGR